MKPLTLAVCITVIAALIIGTCGCTSSSNTSTATPTPTPDYSNYFADKLVANGATTITPMALASNDTYVGTYQMSNKTVTIQITTMDSESAAKNQYGALILEKTNEGFVSNATGASTYGELTVFGTTTAGWSSTKINSLYSGTVFDIMYGHNSDKNVWYVATMRADILE